jgi:hypothetical protein
MSMHCQRLRWLYFDDKDPSAPLHNLYLLQYRAACSYTMVLVSTYV